MKTQAVVFLLLLSGFAYSQDYTDQSLLFSRTGIGGTARTAGAAGAFGSVGADLGSVDINPAGLGLYRSTDFSVTPGIKVSNNESNYNGSIGNAMATKFYLAQAGIEWTKLFKNSTNDNQVTFDRHPLRSITFAINYQSESFFNRSQNFGGPLNSGKSVIDSYADLLNSTTNPVDFNNYPAEIVLANTVNLLTLDPVSNLYTSNVKAPVYQVGNIETRGGFNKISLALGGNLSDKVYFGLGLEIPHINYSVTSTFGENSLDSTTSFIDYSVVSRHEISGFGISGNLGLIYRPAQWVRLGVAYHLPTWYSFNESYFSNIVADYDTASIVPTTPFETTYPNYSLRTPMKGTFSASFYLKKWGFFSVDYELQNLGASHYNFPGDQSLTDTINSYIKSWYGFSHTVRAGFEGAYKVLRLRAGYAFSSSPYKINTGGYGDVRHNITAGIGLRFDRFYVDFAYVYGFSKDFTNTYPIGLIPTVTNKYVTNTMLLTIGWKMGKGSGSRNRSNNSEPPVDDQRY